MPHQGTPGSPSSGPRSNPAHSSTRAAQPTAEPGPPGSRCKQVDGAAHAASILERHAQLTRLNHFEMLGIAETAGRDALHAAYSRSARAFDPDLLGAQHQQLRPLAMAICQRLRAAYKVLDDDQTRMQYLQHLTRDSGSRAAPRRSSARPGTPPPAASATLRPSLPFRPSNPGYRSTLPGLASNSPGVRPSMLTPSVSLPEGWTAQKAFEAARINLKRGALDAALAFAQQACQAEPNDVSFQALHAWLRAQREELKPGPAADAILAVLHRAVRQQRDNLEFRMHRARILQRLGRTEEAIRDFSVVASMDPKNVDAAREVRLHRLRAEQKASSSGLLSKLFSRPPK